MLNQISQTGVDQLLQLGLPSLLLRDLLLDRRDLDNSKVSFARARPYRHEGSHGRRGGGGDPEEEGGHTRSEGSHSMTNFCCFKS